MCLRNRLIRGFDLTVARDMRTDQELQPLAVAKLLAKVVEKDEECVAPAEMPAQMRR